MWTDLQAQVMETLLAQPWIEAILTGVTLGVVGGALFILLSRILLTVADEQDSRRGFTAGLGRKLKAVHLALADSHPRPVPASSTLFQAESMFSLSPGFLSRGAGRISRRYFDALESKAGIGKVKLGRWSLPKR